MKSFTIDVYVTNDAYSACAYGIQGNWSRGLNTALEDLLNKLLQVGIKYLDQNYEHPEKTPFDVEGTSSAGSTPAGTDETQAGP